MVTTVYVLQNVRRDLEILLEQLRGECTVEAFGTELADKLLLSETGSSVPQIGVIPASRLVFHHILASLLMQVYRQNPIFVCLCYTLVASG